MASASPFLASNGSLAASMSTTAVVRLRPREYVHIVDNNNNTVSLVTGPATVTLASHETLACGVTPFHVIGPQQYCRIKNPVMFAEDGKTIVKGKNGQIKNRFGDEEIRFSQSPFPLYPDEEIVGGIQEIRILPSNVALVIKVLLTHQVEDPSGNKVTRHAGSFHLFYGPGQYTPRVEEEIEEERSAVVVQKGTALHLKALNRFVDASGITRYDGEEYLWTKPGAYICVIDEVLVKVNGCATLTRNVALHVEVVKSFVDTRDFAQGVKRNAGDVYLVTNKMTSEFFTHPYETISRTVELQIIPRNKYAVILDPVENGKQILGGRLIVTDTQFFVQPGENLQPVEEAFVLSDDEGVVVKALEDFTDVEVNPTVERHGGDQWLLVGPRTYIPNCHVVICTDNYGKRKRQRITLKSGEGIYVRDALTGAVRSVLGPCAYMLQAYEELWEKELPEDVEKKLQQQLRSHAAYMFNAERGLQREKSRIVSYHIPNQSVTQVYNYKTQTTRTLFGPTRIILEPDEEFNVLTLSGSRWDPNNPSVCLPKEPGRIKALYLFLGPSSMTDVVNVETRDHARLSLQLSYEWYFDVARDDSVAIRQCFTVRDFVADACALIAGRIRACVASLPFETFHRNSGQLLREAVFDVDAGTGEPRKEVRFEKNNFVVTAVDVQEMRVLDGKTREGLHKSVEIAIEITTQAQEAAAQQTATAREQEARGGLEMQTMSDQVEIEELRGKLLLAEAQSAVVVKSGTAKADAEAAANARSIESELSVKLSRLRVEAKQVLEETRELMRQSKRDFEYEKRSEWNKVEITFQQQKNLIDSGLFSGVMGAIDPQTIAEISRAGPELQAKLLGALGLQGYLVTDGTKPINLFDTAVGMTAQTMAGDTSSSGARLVNLRQ